MNEGEHERHEDEELLERAMPGLPPDSGELPELPDFGEAELDRSPRIYVASLSDYNAGRLHGRWIDATQDVEEIHADIRGMLALSPELEAEEWAIHDHDGFGPVQLSEYESLELVSEIAQGIAEHGEAFAAFVEVADHDPSRFPLFEQMYRGRWESLYHYADHLLEELGADRELAQLPEWLRNNVIIHVEGFAEELQANGTIMTMPASEGGLHVFDFE